MCISSRSINLIVEKEITDRASRRTSTPILRIWLPELPLQLERLAPNFKRPLWTDIRQLYLRVQSVRTTDLGGELYGWLFVAQSCRVTKRLPMAVFDPLRTSRCSAAKVSTEPFADLC